MQSTWICAAVSIRMGKLEPTWNRWVIVQVDSCLIRLSRLRCQHRLVKWPSNNLSNNRKANICLSIFHELWKTVNLIRTRRDDGMLEWISKSLDRLVSFRRVATTLDGCLIVAMIRLESCRWPRHSIWLLTCLLMWFGEIQYLAIDHIAVGWFDQSHQFLCVSIEVNGSFPFSERKWTFKPFKHHSEWSDWANQNHNKKSSTF